MACARGALIGVVVRPGRSRPPSSWFCQANIVWNIGSYARLRGGRAISTTCSNGKSSWACASSTRVLTRSRSSPTEGPPERSSRSARLLTKKPIRGSISTRPRLATAAPITKSSWPDNRDRSAAQPANTVMKSVVPRRWLSALSAAVSRSSSSTGAVEPAWSCRAGRGRSLGKSRTVGAPARAPPVVAVRLEIDSGEPVALPDRVIRILDRQVRQRVDPAFAEGGIERAQLAFQDAGRPAVGNDVVQGDEEHMLALREPDQPPAGQGTAFKIECAEALLDDEPLQRAFGVGLAVE